MDLGRPFVVTILCFSFAGCGTKSNPVSVAKNTEFSAPQPAIHVDTEVVANVNGQPILASCIKAQQEREQVDPKQALERCIDFELLAQTALKEKFNDEEAAFAYKRESVRRLLRSDYYRKRTGPNSIPQSYIDRLWDRAIIAGGKRYFLKDFFDRPELRSYSTCAFPFPTAGTLLGEPARKAYEAAGKEIPSVEEEKKLLEQSKIRVAKVAHAQEAAAQLTYIAMLAEANGSGLSSVDFAALCEETTEGMDVKGAEPAAGTETPKPAGTRGPIFAEAAKKLSRQGDFTAPIASSAGWYIVQLDVIMPEVHLTKEQAEPEIRDIVWNGHPIFNLAPPIQKIANDRTKFFLTWYQQFENQTIEIFPENVPDPKSTPSSPQGQ